MSGLLALLDDVAAIAKLTATQIDDIAGQAAKVGANAVVLTGRDTSSKTVGVPVYGGGTVVTSSEVEIVQGVAVWVD